MDESDNLRVVIGAGDYDNNPGWIKTQETELNLLQESDQSNKFSRGSLSAILAEHVWEHLTYEKGKAAARLCFDFLKPGGYIRCAVPDGFFPNKDYQAAVQIGGPGPDDHPASSHKIVHNYRTISRMFEEVGFKVDLLEYCDQNGEFYYNDWDEKQGYIYRSKRFDHRNEKGSLGFVSVIVDAVKPKR